jgi:hypothetical protein
MDRHNWNLPSSNYYSSDYYNQADGQHASQPEAGQTSSGPSWSLPTQGQPRPYLDLNFPPPGGVDWHSSIPENYYQIHQQGDQYAFPPEAGQTDQSIALEAGSHNDIPAELSNPQIRRRGASAQVKEGFLAGLEKYAQGYQLKECSENVSFKAYITDKGNLHKSGKSLYDNLKPEERDRVNQAISSRREFYAEQSTKMNRVSTEARFLSGLENYESGKSLRQCAKDIAFRNYVTSEGDLQFPRGIELYRRSGPNVQERIDQALATRKAIAAATRDRDIHHFMEALVPYSNGLDLKTCGKQSGLENKAERYLTPEGGLTDRGELLIENLLPEQQNYVLSMLKQRRQHMEQSIQVQESSWQQPDITQTEAMRAAIWQFTGQTMQGTFEMPPEPIRPSSIRHFDQDDVGDDFCHQYGPNGLMPQKAPDRLISRGIMNRMKINIMGEEYRVRETKHFAITTNENPQGKSFMLVPRMRGG